MKIITSLIITVSLCVIFFITANAGEDYLLVETIDNIKRVFYQIMNPQEFETLQESIKTEKRLFKKNLDLTKKEWEKDAANVGVPFPAAAITPKEARLIGKFPDLSKASEKKVYYESRSAGKDDKSKKTDWRAGQAKANYLTSLKAADEKDKQKERIRQSALALFEAKLLELKSAEIQMNTPEKAQ